ncbi:MAG: HD domain-containing phosphohydrolase [Thermodesulfobacteriota bacterium]
MKVDLLFIKSRLGRRMFLLFISCALLPVCALAVLSYSHVTGDLRAQSHVRLHQGSKVMGMAIMERLMFLEGALGMAASHFGKEDLANPGWLRHLARKDGGKYFEGISFLEESGRAVLLYGRAILPFSLTAGERTHLGAGMSVLRTFRAKEGPRIYIIQRIQAVIDRGPLQGLLVGDVNPPYLWGLLEIDTLPATTEVCILDSSGTALFSSVPISTSLLGGLREQLRRSSTSRFEWHDDDRQYLAGYWCLFLHSQFRSPSWTVVMSQSKDEVYAAAGNFKRIFPLVILLSLWVVLLLTMVQIRRNLVPLQRLKAGTKRIAGRDFDARVAIRSGDEFEELGDAFNSMAKRIGTHFSALSALSEIDRALLSALERDKIIHTTLTRIKEVFHCDLVGMAILEGETGRKALSYIGSAKPGAVNLVESVEVTPADLEDLKNHPSHLVYERGKERPGYLAPFARRGYGTFLVLPVLIKRSIEALISLAYIASPILDREDLGLARHFADQVGVALSNAHLMEDLDDLSMGTLTSLARAVDTKSAWTGGHSERVTEIALKIGSEMGLSSNDLQDLQRGGLLHDVGKIGIPTGILDKPGRLTDEEYDIIKQHPRMGLRILEPIKNFASIIQLVLQHHERFDGKGYPDGVSGEQISLGGRILAVSDVYDALISDRPYRAGMSLDRTLSIIREESGRQFDPAVVEAFLRVIEREGDQVKKHPGPADKMAVGSGRS